MPSIRLTKFGGINTEIAPRLLPIENAQIAHNCLLWDGSLRPMAEWTKLIDVNPQEVNSISIASDGVTVQQSKLRDAGFLTGPMYAAETKIGLGEVITGIDSNITYANRYTPADGRLVGVHPPTVTAATVSYSRQYRSEKPVNRIYAITGYRTTPDGAKEESILTVLPGQSAKGIIYEGDTVSITATVDPPNGIPYSGLRLYRTISGLDTGQALTNEFDTDWFLVADIPQGASFTFIDGGSAANSPLDLCLSQSFYPPLVKYYEFLQVSDGGWVGAASVDGNIIVSERYLYHAWPTENHWLIPDEIRDFAAQGDSFFIGTKNRPYILSIAPGEKLGLQGNVVPYPEAYECLYNTMVRTPAGAAYASPHGLVALDRERMRLVSEGMSSGMRPLYNIPVRIEQDVDGQTRTYTKHYAMKYEHTVYGAYYHGMYLGFCAVDSGTLDGVGQPLYYFKGYAANLGSSLDAQRPLQRLVTFDTPNGVKFHTVGGSGIYVLGTDGIYTMPFPDSANNIYNRSKKYCYNWKSKKFVFPGNMTMAAAKVVHDCKGFVRIKFYVDCCCVYEAKVKDCKPFLLPPNMAGVEWEIELVGTATVSEVHVASSLRELLEDE